MVCSAPLWALSKPEERPLFRSSAVRVCGVLVISLALQTEGRLCFYVHSSASACSWLSAVLKTPESSLLLTYISSHSLAWPRASRIVHSNAQLLHHVSGEHAARGVAVFGGFADL